LEHADGHTAGEAVLPAQEQCQKQIQRILQSAAFRNASTLQQLLQYLAARAFDHGAETLKEYTIGVEALGRPHDFDPKTDTIVRVQIHRLRQKLREYYDSDGSRDPIIVDIPKGHYLPGFAAVAVSDAELNVHSVPHVDARVSVAASFIEHPVEEKTGPLSEEKTGHAAISIFLRSLAAVAVAAAIFVSGFWIGGYRYRVEEESATARTDRAAVSSADPVKAFWLSFLGNDPSPVIAYPDAVFLLDNFNDLFRFRRGATDFRGAPVDPHLAQQFASNPALVARAGQLYYENSYLGFGELKAVGMLSNLFGQLGLKPVIKPSRELTVDDLKQHNVIMLGSSSQNIAVAQLSNVGDFSFKNPDSLLEQWRGQIVNAHPHADEAASYRTERDPNTQVLKADYALITIQPGIIPGRYIADLGGLDTTGSEGAVLYATSKLGIEELSRALAGFEKPGVGNSFPTFQALLRVRLEKGYDVLGASLVTVHRIPAPQTETADNRSAEAWNE
jgi:hypothetical protein